MLRLRQNYITLSHCLHFSFFSFFFLYPCGGSFVDSCVPYMKVCWQERGNYYFCASLWFPFACHFAAGFTHTWTQKIILLYYSSFISCLIKDFIHVSILFKAEFSRPRNKVDECAWVCVSLTWWGTRPRDVGGSFILSSLLLATA